MYFTEYIFQTRLDYLDDLSSVDFVIFDEKSWTFSFICLCGFWIDSDWVFIFDFGDLIGIDEVDDVDPPRWTWLLPVERPNVSTKGIA